MKISIAEVEKVAKLARLRLTEEQKRLFTEQIDQILFYMEKLNEIDTKEIEPTYHATKAYNVFREDKVVPSLEKDKVFQNAPDASGGSFRVPRVI